MLQRGFPHKNIVLVKENQFWLEIDGSPKGSSPQKKGFVSIQSLVR